MSLLRLLGIVLALCGLVYCAVHLAAGGAEAVAFGLGVAGFGALVFAGVLDFVGKRRQR